MSKSFGAEGFSSPPPDAARVAHLRHALDPVDTTSVAALAEPARDALRAGVERLLGEVRTLDIAEAADHIEQIGVHAAALDPQDLNPSGLGGLFGGRRRALRRFVDRFENVCAVIDPLASGLGERLQRLKQRVEALDGLHDQAKTFILEFDAHVAAARQSLARLDPDHATRAALERRIGELTTIRRGAIEQLSCARLVQNVDASLTRVLTRAIESVSAWREDWADRLGLRLDRRVATRPDERALAEARAALVEALKPLGPLLDEASARREEAVARMSRAAEAVRGRR